jgi:hypothetical protein
MAFDLDNYSSLNQENSIKPGNDSGRGPICPQTGLPGDSGSMGRKGENPCPPRI